MMRYRITLPIVALALLFLLAAPAQGAVRFHVFVGPRVYAPVYTYPYPYNAYPYPYYAYPSYYPYANYYVAPGYGYYYHSFGWHHGRNREVRHYRR